MRIGLLGTGRMGQAVRAAALARGHEVVWALGGTELRTGSVLGPEQVAAVDVIIEFTRPAAVVANLFQLADLGAVAVTGTTGWNDRLEEVSARFGSGTGALLHAANFSLGAHLMLRAARALAAAVRGRAEFDGTLLEVHHSAKLDAPSGTALALQSVLGAQDPDRAWPITSIRTGQVPGTHTLTLEGGHETLTLTHTVRNRAVFAEGAVIAAEWLKGRRGVFTLDHLLGGAS